MPWRIRFSVAVMVLATAPDATSALKSVREYRFRPPRDRHVVFAMAVTPNQEVLTFIASQDGKWRLSRVRRWLDKEPDEDKIVVPGLVYGEREDWNGPWSPKLLVTPDGNFAVCIASAWRSRGRGQDEFVSVVDLAGFKVVASIHTPAIASLGGQYRKYDLDRRGSLVAQAFTPRPPNPDDNLATPGNAVKLAILSLPDLAVKDQCEYSEWARGGQPVRRDGEGECSALLGNEGGFTSFSEFLGSFVKTDEVAAANYRARPPQCWPLGYAVYASQDGRYKREVCLAEHRGFWGRPVVTKSVENIFSVRTGDLVGSVNEPVDSMDSRFASVNRVEYLIVVEGGTRLTIFEIEE